MKIKYIPAAVTLIAGAITCFICISQKYDTIYSLELLLGTLAVFCILGVIAQKIVIKVQVVNQKQRVEKQKRELEEERREKEEAEKALSEEEPEDENQVS